jgi:anti-sigma regulatory factor (Ser/Thr protein kinase)
MDTSDDLQLVAELIVPADAEMLTVCRMVLVGVGEGLPLTDEALEDLKLVLSEACASAIEHSPGAGDTVEIAFRTSDGELEVSVSDHGRGAERAMGGLGFGMPLLRQLCSRLDVGPRSDGPGTVVRFAQTLPA